MLALTVGGGWFVVSVVVAVVTTVAARRRRRAAPLVPDPDLPQPLAVVSFQARLTPDELRAVLGRLQLNRGRPVARA
jgi:hypothetical protein